VTKGKGWERKGKGGEGMLTLMRCWNRAADWLRPAPDVEIVDKRFSTPLTLIAVFVE